MRRRAPQWEPRRRRGSRTSSTQTPPEEPRRRSWPFRKSRSSLGTPSTQSPAVRSVPASLRRVHAPLFVRWHGVGVGVESAPASASGLGRGVGPGLWIPCRRGRRRGRCGPRRGRRFQVQVPARPRISAEITVCRWGSLQPFSRDVHSYTTPWATYGSTASSATAASMPPALVRAIADVRANDGWALVGSRGCPARPPRWRGRLFSSGGSRRARTGLLQRWGSVLHEGPYWLSHQLLSAFAAMDREPGYKRPISAIESA